MFVLCTNIVQLEKIKKNTHYDDTNAVANNMPEAETKTKGYTSSKYKSVSGIFIYSSSTLILYYQIICLLIYYLCNIDVFKGYKFQ